MNRQLRSIRLVTSILAGSTALAVSSSFGVTTYLITDLGSLGGGFATAAAINDSNQVAGASSIAAGPQDAFLFSGGVMHDLGNLGGVSAASAINSRGDVAGSSSVSLSGTTNHPFLFRNGLLQDLGLPAGLNTGSASGVNDADQVVGTFISGTRRQTVTHAFLWQSGGFMTLGTLGGTSASASAISEQHRGRVPERRNPVLLSCSGAEHGGTIRTIEHGERRGAAS